MYPAQHGLTDAEKKYHLDRLEEAHAAGKLDPLLDLQLLRLNDLDGVVTTSSCAGHPLGGMGWVDLRLSDTMWRWATAFLAELVCRDDVHLVVKLVYKACPHADGGTFAIPVLQVWSNRGDMIRAINALVKYLINCPPPFPN